MIGLGLSIPRVAVRAGDALVREVLSILSKYGTDAHVYLPGIGVINGLTAGNYLESTGSTQAAVDNPVGLVLDANGTVGANVVTNGDFSSGTGWDISAGTIVISGGKLNITAAASGAFIRQLTKLTAGKTYEVTYTIDSMSAGGIAFYDTVVNDTTRTAAGTYTSRFKASGTALGFTCIGASTTAVIDNLSVKEVTGIHATQATTANKPILRSSGGLYSWQFDGTDSLALSSNLYTSADDFFCCAGIKYSSGAYPFPICLAGNGATSAKYGAMFIHSGAMEFRVGSTTDAAVDSGLSSSTGLTVVAGTAFVGSVYKTGGRIKPRKNGVAGTDHAAPAGTFTLNSGAIGNAANGGSGLIGSLYPVVGIKGAVLLSEVAVIERWIGTMCGVQI